MNSFIYKNKSWLLKIKRFINKTLRFDIVKYPTAELTRRERLLTNQNISLVLDVGANIGQYATELRSIGYTGKIFSFEPVSESFKKLEKASRNDSNWQVFNFSLGDFEGETEINISKNSVSSSILNNLPQLTESAPDAIFVSKEKIKVKTIDVIFDELNLDSETVFLKIDTQGYESKVIAGAKNSLSKIKALQIEMSLVPSYEGVLSFEEMSEDLKQKGFSIFSIESGYFDTKTGKLLEVDGVFLSQ
ncbi:MAG: FkbM family methyltransferase [Flavobacterium haoranii]